jgi:hypothetical protein
METEKKNKMRMIVRDVMSQKVESLIENDIFMDNEVRDRIFDSLPSDLEIDDEIEECLLNGEDGWISNKVCEMFIDTLTDSFMNRFETK